MVLIVLKLHYSVKSGHYYHWQREIQICCEHPWLAWFGGEVHSKAEQNSIEDETKINKTDKKNGIYVHGKNFWLIVVIFSHCISPLIVWDPIVNRFLQLLEAFPDTINIFCHVFNLCCKPFLYITLSLLLLSHVIVFIVFLSCL